MRILLVEDQSDLAAGIKTMLERHKYAVTVVDDGVTGVDHLLRPDAYDAAILDVVLPRLDGFAVCRRARAERVQTPVLMLTARDAVEDRVAGLECGADDYLVKPFDIAELMARLRALLRRGNRPLRDRIALGALALDSSARTATYAGALLELGATEFRLLELLVRNAGITLTRTQILERIWDYEFEGSSNIVDVYVSQLRRKLRQAGAPRALIATVWGTGYRIAAV